MSRKLPGRKNIDGWSLKPYVQKILDSIDSLQNNENDVIADNALMLSTLLQNYLRTYSQ